MRTSSGLAAGPKDRVMLKEQPDGYLSSSYPVTPGQCYDVLDTMGSCLVVSTDIPGETASIWRGRFEVVI
jgi:hypothetical protein